MITPGAVLKKRREELELTIKQVSQETKINEKHLEQIEADQYSDFDSPVFASGFIKNYANFLQLDTEKILALYRRVPNEETARSKKTKQNPLESFKKYITPKNLTTALVVVAVGAVLIYLNSQFRSFNTTPELSIATPSEDITTTEESITIKGTVSPNSQLTINDKLVSENQISFSYKIDLELGENVFVIKAENNSNSSKSISKTFKATRELEEQEQEIEEAPTQEYSIIVRITEESAWIKLTIDDEQKMAQIIGVGDTEAYTATKSLELVSGRPSITVLLVNGTEQHLSINPETGVASLSCAFAKGEGYICE